MAASQGMCAAQCNNLTVVETHAPEDGTEVRLFLGAVGKTTVGCAHTDVPIRPAGPPGDNGALHFLDGADAGEGPEVGVGYPWEFD